MKCKIFKVEFINENGETERGDRAFFNEKADMLEDDLRKEILNYFVNSNKKVISIDILQI